MTDRPAMEPKTNPFGSLAVHREHFRHQIRKQLRMGKSLYKYVGPSHIDKVLGQSGFVTLKCGLPSEFNDPYELFLTMDFKEEPELIAFYADAVGKLPQLPVTCFSRSPSVVPMWAHYAEKLQGFVLEFDEEKIVEHCPKSGFGDIDYRDEPSDAVAKNLSLAYHIGKFRYMAFLHRSVFSAAYYTKQTCWAYEMERRMIVDPSEVVDRFGLTLCDLPKSALKSIISGPRSTKEAEDFLSTHAAACGSQFLRARIGRSTGIPYFLDSSDRPLVFVDGSLVQAMRHCASCREPIEPNFARCSWCRITDSHRENAADRNSYRILAAHGMLESYLEGIRKIERGERE